MILWLVFSLMVLLLMVKIDSFLIMDFDIGSNSVNSVVFFDRYGDGWVLSVNFDDFDVWFVVEVLGDFRVGKNIFIGDGWVLVVNKVE